MPPSHKPTQQSTRPAASVGTDDYPPQAYEFVHEGLDYTVGLHSNGPGAHHVTGQQLCEGLRELALARWGRMAKTVLRRWNIRTTLDFGHIVYSQIEIGQMQKLEDDTLDDFKNVYDFAKAFEVHYRIPSHK